MNILVINSGSSSIKFSIFRAEPGRPDADPQTLVDGELSNIGGNAQIEVAHTGQKPAASAVQAKDPEAAAHAVADELAKPEIPSIDAVGYRVVHPGPKLDRHQRITPQVLAALEAAKPFAPLHEPEALTLIRAFMQRFPNLPHFACFDTVFHQTMPEAATTYPIPLHFRDQGVRRYGFHGLSCESVVRQLRRAPGIAFPARMIIAHLGSGCSVTALEDGESIDTSMGLTPTGGVVMGTRPGDLDPGLIFFLLRQPGATIDSVESMLNHESGIKALFGSNDMRKLRETGGRDPRANLALDIFLTSVRRSLGGMLAVHHAQAIIFTGGIGEHDARTRVALASFLVGDQPELEPSINQASLSGLRKISAEESNIAVYVVPAQEDLMIALHVARMVANASS